MNRKPILILAITGIMLISLAVVLFVFFSKPTGVKTADEQKEDTSIEASSAPTEQVQVAQPSTGVSAQSEDGMKVKVDQVGYKVESAKIAIIEGEFAEALSFTIEDASDGKMVLTGTLSEPIADQASRQTVRRADFSALQADGIYRVVVDGVGSSYPFAIGEAVYDDALASMLRSYTLQRSGIDIDDPVTGLKQKAGHLQDAQAVLYFDDDISRKGETIDVSGGWYDAGDFGKYIPPAAVAVAQLLLAYEINEESFPIGQMALQGGLKQQEAALPDVLSEVQYELEWMLRMQRSDGAVYHKVSGEAWTGFVTPDTDTQTRYVYGLSTYGTAQFAGATALAARIYKPFDVAFSERLLAAAEKAQAYLSANPGAMFRKDENQDSGSGAYEKSTDVEERFWAAAELFRTTGNSSYSNLLTQQFGIQFDWKPPAVNWANTLLLGQWAYYNAENSDALLKERIRKAITGRADELVRQAGADGYLNTLMPEEYTWASAKAGAAYGCFLLLANAIQPNEDYTATALEQLHHVFGRTATGYSYVTGIGTQYPQEPHHRTGAASGILIPGLVVGGPNQYGGDPDLDAVKDGLAPAKAYLDILASYSSNEYAIDYNAPVMLLASYFAK